MSDGIILLLLLDVRCALLDWLGISNEVTQI